MVIISISNVRCACSGIVVDEYCMVHKMKKREPRNNDECHICHLTFREEEKKERETTEPRFILWMHWAQVLPGGTD